VNVKTNNTLNNTEGNQYKNIQHVFIIGSKGIPARYGGFESFVDKLTYYQKSHNIQYHVACLAKPLEYNFSKQCFQYNGAECFNIRDINIGPAKAIVYDLNALKYSISYIKENKVQNPIIYILACRIGPLIGHYKKVIKKLGGHIYVNPDGHEWMRQKWSGPVRKYWKVSEKLMVKHAELLICDSKNIEMYIKKNYKQYNPNTTFIAYGAETRKSKLADDDLIVTEWYKAAGVNQKEYYLVVGRFVPENNYERMIKEFMNSNTNKDFVLITGYEGVAFYKKLKLDTKFDNDKRIKFVGTIYDQELLKKIRENAYGYIHGHEVGGTNPSLLEALGSTEINLLLDVGFNREVGEEGAIYWSKQEGNLSNLIEKTDILSCDEIKMMGCLAKLRINNNYSWNFVIDRYEDVFLNGKEGG